jgi:hypothetical protein
MFCRYFINFPNVFNLLKKKSVLLYKPTKMSIDSAPLPKPEDFIAAVSSTLKQLGKSEITSLTNATVLEKGGRRGCCYIDCSSVESATEIVSALENSVVSFLPDSNVDTFWTSKQLIVSQKINIDQETKSRTPTNSILVSYKKDEKPRNSENNNQNQQQIVLNVFVAPSQPAVSSSQTHQQQQAPSSNSNNQVAPTLYIRCKKIFKVPHVFDFFRQHNIVGHAEDCVYCSTSKKPYFLVDWGRNTKAYDACLLLDGLSVQGEQVSIKQSNQSAADYKEKKPEVISLQTNREKKIRQRDDEAADLGANFLPISVLMNNNNKKNDDDDDGPKKPPQPE